MGNTFNLESYQIKVSIMWNMTDQDFYIHGRLGNIAHFHGLSVLNTDLKYNVHESYISGWWVYILGQEAAMNKAREYCIGAKRFLEVRNIKNIKAEIV